MGTVNLSKSQVINLNKLSQTGLTDVIVGLGWDPAKHENIAEKTVVTKKASLFGKLFKGETVTERVTRGGRNIDCDAFCVAVDDKNKHINMVSFMQLSALKGAIRHTGDNLTGDGDGDDEQIIIKLHELPTNVNKLIIGVNVFSGQNFGEIDNAFIRLEDLKTHREMCIYKLSGTEYSNTRTVIFGELYRDTNNEWQFKAVGEADKAKSITEFANRFR